MYGFMAAGLSLCFKILYILIWYWFKTYVVIGANKKPNWFLVLQMSNLLIVPNYCNRQHICFRLLKANMDK